MAHARLGPSNHRWPHCPGSIREEANYEDSAGPAAVDGTGTHLFVELCLLSSTGIWTVASEWVGRLIGEGHKDRQQGWHVEPDRAERVQMCLEYLKRRWEELTLQYPGAVITIGAEIISDPGGMHGRTDWWGTCDITITVMVGNECMFIETVDYKDGRGWVNAENNSQLQSYLLGQMRKYVASGPELVLPFRPQGVRDGGRMTIIQPKTKTPIRYQDITTADLLKINEDLFHAAQATDDPNAPLIPDDKNGKGHCTWCKHRKNCGALNAKKSEGLSLMTDVTTRGGGSLFEILQSGAVSLDMLPGDKLAELMDAVPAITSLLANVTAEAERREVESPGSVPGYEMGTGRATKVWVDDDATVEKKLKGMRVKKNDIFPAKLLSPAQALKLPDITEQQRERIEKQMISEVDGKDKLVRSRGVTEKPVAAVSQFAEVDPNAQFYNPAAQEPASSQEPAAAELPAVAPLSFM